MRLGETIEQAVTITATERGWTIQPELPADAVVPEGHRAWCMTKPSSSTPGAIRKVVFTFGVFENDQALASDDEECDPEAVWRRVQEAFYRND